MAMKMERDEPEIRLAGPGDAERIASVLAASFAEHKAAYTPGGYAATVPGADEIERRFGEGPVWVATRAGEVVGTVSVVDKGDALYVRSMAVAPAARGRRVGESLLRRVESYAAGRGYARLVLSTTPFLHRATRLYERFGFTRNGDGPHELAGTPLFTMEKILRRDEAYMTKLSVNLNKVALLRNARNIGIPSVTKAAQLCIAAGAHGITVHPRPDERHAKPSDVYELANLLAAEPGVEFNIEGNPFPKFMEIVRAVRPTQCTLVPDSPEAFTSDHGWNLTEDGERLKPIIAELKSTGVRVSLFMDADGDQMERAREVGADRIELYTEPYAAAYKSAEAETVFERFAAAARRAQEVGLGVNAGHDLNLENLSRFCSIPNILEVSIGHALVSDALEMGLAGAVRAYLKILSECDSRRA